tara:strand:+ start:110 stop:349 length:240 start_codon:yes stop_codon:yes gene_type:complete
MAFKEKVLEDLRSFLPDEALLLNEEATSRQAGGLHTEEPVNAKLIVRPKSTLGSISLYRVGSFSRWKSSFGGWSRGFKK